LSTKRMMTKVIGTWVDQRKYTQIVSLLDILAEMPELIESERIAQLDSFQKSAEESERQFHRVMDVGIVGANRKLAIPEDGPEDGIRKDSPLGEMK
jgi:hypothetical protein